MGCLVAGVVLELLFVAGQEKSPELPVLDILPGSGRGAVNGGICLVRLRVNSIATILSFERNAQAMADLSSAIIGMGCVLAAIIMTIISSFFRTVTKMRKSEGCLITGTLILTFENGLGILKENRPIKTVERRRNNDSRNLHW